MAKITFVEHDGTEHVVDAKNGVSLMETALHNNVPGIDGDCGGACACATCHIFVADEWSPKVGGPASDTETDMLSFADGSTDKSRLGCQVTVSDILDGLVVRLPVGQH